MKKNKFLLLIVLCLLISNLLYQKIYNFQFNKIKKDIENESKDNSINENNKSYKRSCQILENNFTEIIINEGSDHNIKINMICEGENGFIGFVSQVEKNYSIIKTFWYVNWKLVVLDGKNNYGYLKSNGIFLIIQVNKNEKNFFIENENIYIIDKNNFHSLLGKVRKLYNNYYKVYPVENIFNLKKVYLTKRKFS
jgi:hypothetical protein